MGRKRECEREERKERDGEKEFEDGREMGVEGYMSGLKHEQEEVSRARGE